MSKTIFCCLFFLPLFITAQQIDKKLTRKLIPILQGFNGEVGLYVKNLDNGKIVQINADTIFPTASMIKVPIMIGVMDKIEKAELQYDQPLEYRDSLLYAGVDILGSYKEGEKIELQKVMMLMLTMSDNTASLWLQSLAGTGTRINEIMSALGMQYTRVNSRTPGREDDWKLYGWGQTTPREMATLFEMIWKGNMISPAASAEMIRILNRNFWNDAALSVISPGTFIMSKNGAVNASRSEVVLVNGRKGSYVFCITTKNNKDQSWQHENEAWQMTRKVSETLFHYFEPKSDWKLPQGSEKYY